MPMLPDGEYVKIGANQREAKTERDGEREREMGSLETTKNLKPHAVCIPFPAQGHINPMLSLSKLLHHKGFHITFVNTEYNHRRLLKSRGSGSLSGFPSFRFETIPDGLPPSENEDSTQDVPSLAESTSKTCAGPFRDLLTKLNKEAVSSNDLIPPVSCVVSDCVMGFTLKVTQELGIPNVFFWTASVSGFMGYLQYRQLMEKGLFPLKDETFLTNGFLDTVIDWIPGMEGITLKELPSFLRTTDPNDIMVNFALTEVERAQKASGLIFNSFDSLEQDVLDALSPTYPKIYTIGPLQLQINQLKDDPTTSIATNLWKEEGGCIEWLDSKEPGSVVYVNFGSVTVVTPEQLTEFAWGLASSKQTFLWVIRSDLIIGDSAMLPPEFVKETEERSLLVGWCPQEKVLNHPSIGGFLTHCGWNSTIESVCGGVPIICWPFFAEQQTNAWYARTRWGVGMEIDSDVRREKVEKLVRELMVGDKGKEMKRKAVDLKAKAQEATKLPGGSSYVNLEKLVKNLLMSKVSC